MQVVKTWENVGINPLTRNLDTRWRWALQPGHFIPEENAGCNPSVAPFPIRSLLRRNKILYPFRESNYNSSAAHPVACSLHGRSNVGFHTEYQHIAFVRFYTREYYWVCSWVRSRRTFERCRMKFHVYAHRQITHARSDFTPDPDACACLVPGTVDRTTDWAVTTNWPNAIPIHPPGSNWMVCVCVCVCVCVYMQRSVAGQLRAEGSKVRHNE